MAMACLCSGKNYLRIHQLYQKHNNLGVVSWTAWASLQIGGAHDAGFLFKTISAAWGCYF